MNHVTLIGNVGADPDCRRTQNGLNMANLSVATSENVKDGEGGRVQQTEWHRLVFFGKNAEFVKGFVGKGATICVQGSLKTREYEKEGQKHFSTNIVVKEIKLVKKGSNQLPFSEKRPGQG